MSNYKSLIDEAMKTAQYRLNAGVTKEASVSNDDSLIKEASELANALEYMSMDSANDGSLVGQARAEVIRDFHKAATAQRLGVKLAGDVGESSTMSSGMQYLPPQSGKTKLSAIVDKDGNPLVTASPDSTGHTMLESYKQANTGTTLYDILMHEKEAGDVGEYDADQYLAVTGANENSNRRILDDAYIIGGVTKQEAKAPVRDRLSEAFAGTSDTLGDQTMKGMFPAAYQASGLKKTAMSPLEEFLMEKEAGGSNHAKNNRKRRKNRKPKRGKRQQSINQTQAANPDMNVRMGSKGQTVVEPKPAPKLNVRPMRPKGVPTFIPGATLESVQEQAKADPVVRPKPSAAPAPKAPAVSKGTKEVAEKAKSLGKGSQAALLGTALVGGMAAKQYVHNKKKQYLAKRAK